MDGKGRGYKGQSMSVNAVLAYDRGEKPLSKWTKAAILEEIENMFDELPEEKADMIKKMTLTELRENFLNYTAYHHTGKFYNSTNFYQLNADRMENITVEEIGEIISRRKKTARRPQAIIDAEKAERAKKKAEKEAAEEKAKLFRYQNKYKTLKGFLNSSSVDLEALQLVRAQKIAEKREQLRKNWEKQEYSYGLENIGNDEFVEKYIR